MVGVASAIGLQRPCRTGYSAILQTSSICDKENIDPDDPMEWLHRNHNYVRRYGPSGDIHTSTHGEYPYFFCSYLYSS